MKQGKFYTKLILWIFLAAVLCYFGYAIFSAVYAPLTTVTAIEYEAGNGSYTTGYVVREETVVRSTYGITALVVSEGEKVSRGQVLATGYRDESAQARQEELEELEQQEKQLTYASSYSADTADQAVLDSEISAQLIDMSQYLARGDMNSVSDRTAALKGLIIRRMSTEAENAALDQQIADLRAQIAALQSDADYDTTVHFISEEELLRDHAGIPHGGFVIRSGKTGWNQENTHVIEYSLKLDSNPEFTSSVLAAYARAAYRLSQEGVSGCRTVFDIAPAYLSVKSGEELRKSML